MNAVRAVVALGSNLDGPEARVRLAFDEVGVLPSTRLLARSALYRTAPVGYLDQPAFVNACALVETSLGPRELLEGLLAIERRHGRVRDIPDGPRTLDLDIALYDDLVMHEHGLTLPHPRAHERAFVLVPLLDVWPDAVIPGRGAAASLRDRVGDQAIERLPDNP
ncbi:MAG TPA: 2-amino-4-hydroxy-6-hydroxymethyldihydropteridine diphosphokinase [Usitatibacteraceae bacterium]|nr:2-amino-4-hydroxy-6-hydroxymethyldihydropteridine diphosphokinase [Usitatibacteraceae bacterium]